MLSGSHRDRLVDPRLDVPAGRIAAVREERVDAGNGLLRILGVHFIFCLAVLFGDGEDTQGLEGLEGVGGLRVEHAGAEKEVIPDVNSRGDGDDGDENSPREAGPRNHVNLS
jgi:hypothetical protein